jgi:hypothetical protein
MRICIAVLLLALLGGPVARADYDQCDILGLRGPAEDWLLQQTPSPRQLRDFKVTKPPVDERDFTELFHTKRTVHLAGKAVEGELRLLIWHTDLRVFELWLPETTLSRKALLRHFSAMYGHCIAADPDHELPYWMDQNGDLVVVKREQRHGKQGTLVGIASLRGAPDASPAWVTHFIDYE